MALGGGTFVAQDKVIPGSYINFVSNGSALSALSDRGTGCIGTYLDWFDDNLIEISASDFSRNSTKLFGYDYDDLKVSFARDFFKHGTSLIVGCLYENAVKAKVTGATNKFTLTASKYGTVGNKIKVIISTNVSNESIYDVKTYLGTGLVHSITGITNITSKNNNEWWTISADSKIAGIETLSFSGGVSGHSSTGNSITNFLNKVEKKSFNTLAICGNWTENGFSDCESVAVIVAFTKRMRDEVGVKFQTVIYSENASDADYEGVIRLNQKFGYTIDGKYLSGKGVVMPWLVGALAGCNINSSITNMTVDSIFNLGSDDEKTQTELEKNINTGVLSFHTVGDDNRVLTDINSLHTFTQEKGKDFSNNQTVRVLDQIGLDVAKIFNTMYIGKIQNDAKGRASLWKDICKYVDELNSMRAVEGFTDEDCTIEAGNDKVSVVVNLDITPVNAMEKLYMRVCVN